MKKTITLAWLNYTITRQISLLLIVLTSNRINISNSASSLSNNLSSGSSISPLSSNANGKILFLGQSLNEVDFKNQYIDENYYWGTSIPESNYLDGIITVVLSSFCCPPYPKAVLNPSQRKTYLTSYTYEDGFNTKTLDDFGVVT